MKLNPDQLAAVNAGLGAWMTLSGPGSGKTRVLIERYKRLTAAGERVQCLTFTRKAAAEMRERAGARPGDFRTFHSLARQIVGVECDLDKLIPAAVFKLECRPSWRVGRWGFPWIMVDEANDLTLEQVRLLQLLAENHGNIWFCGDACQAIYSFAGSTPEPMVNFPKFFPGGKYLTMGVNYRSTKRIVDFCRRLAPIQTELLDRMNTDNEEGEPITFSQYPNNIAELASAADEDRDGIVLARTNRQIAPIVESGSPAMTIHKAKGLQWDDVWVIGAQDGLLPLGGADEEEEKRLLFVAASRAAKRLHFSCYGTPSRLLQPFLADGTILRI